MKAAFIFAALGLVFRLAPAACADLSPDSRAPIQLFNGRDLSGWTPFPALAPDGTPIWSVHDGLIRCVGTPKGYLRTNAVFSNYRLRVQWRWVGKPGNSGVFVHGSGLDEVWPHCYEAQLLAGNAGELRANGGAKFNANSQPKDRSRPRLAPSSERAPGEWNDYDILCRGGTIVLVVNGIRQNEIENLPPTSGWIALQSEGGVIEFRGLTLEPLGP